MTLVIDYREVKLIAACKKLGIPFRVTKVEMLTGDVTNEAGTFIAEIKMFLDFWSSMVDGRIPNQEWKMYENYSSNRYVFVEYGTLADLAETRKKDKNWIYSTYGTIENWDCNFREFTDIEDLALKLHWLDMKLGTERVVRDVVVRLYNKTVAQKALRQFGGVAKKADAMLKVCGSLRDVFEDLLNNNGEKLSAIKGIAPLPKGKILSQMIVDFDKRHT